MTDWSAQLAAWSQWLDDHRDDPALIAGAHRLGKRMTSAGGAS